MKKEIKKRGFISISVMYSFLVLFLLLTISIMSSYINREKMLKYMRKEAVEEVDEIEKELENPSYEEEEWEPKIEIGTIYNFEYTGTEREFTVPSKGKYKVEVWGAQGGYRTATANGGKGGYSKGEVNLEENDELYIYVGASGNTGGVLGGFNGGGSATSYGGGGATDMRIGGNTLNHRFIVAGGGGSDAYSGYDGKWYAGGAGGGTSGVGGLGFTNSTKGDGATQTTGSTFGKGGNSTIYHDGAGGGGWYGGTSGKYYTGGADYGGRAGGGGSGYIWTSSTASNVPSGYEVNTKYYLFNYEIKRGNEVIPNPEGGTITGKEGNGYARITYLGKDTRTSEFLASIESKTPYGISEPGEYKLKIPASGKYKVEVWGAQGGYRTATANGGKGGYSKGEVNLTAGEDIYICVGASGNTGEVLGGFNGGGGATSYGGGGATDMRIGGNTLNHRFIVAGGGGSDAYSGYDGKWYAGGAGGGTSGVGGLGYTNSTKGDGATQTTGYSFGKGGNPTIYHDGAGGGGWYGGTSGKYYTGGSDYGGRAGGGGSGYIWTSSTESNVSSDYLVEEKYFLSKIQIKRGNEIIPDPSSTTGGTITGKTGNGYAQITYLGK